MLIEGWVVLPDRPDARRVMAPWPWLSQWVLAYASGRPWVVGNLDRDEVTLATVGSLRVAVIGSCPVTATQLTELVIRVRTAAELDAVARALPGCFHVVASIDGVVRVQGSLAGLRRVFHTWVQGVPVASDRADMLAMVAGAGVDEQALAVRVACGPWVPPPVGEHSLWRGVRTVAPDHYLRMDPRGTVAEVRWWQPAEPEVGLTIGAGAVRQALEAAVVARRPARGRLSADSSGGMDSTSLCFLAARAGMPDLLIFWWAETDGADDDASALATYAADALCHAEHRVLAPADIPAIFADPGDAGDTEAPYPFTRTLARLRQHAELLASHGARHHLAGHGGDELFHGPLAYLPALLRRQPVTAIRHVRGHRALHRWSLAATVSALAHCGDLAAWWRQQAQQLSTGTVSGRVPDLGWGHPLRAPVWVTPAAIDATRAVLDSTAAAARPLATDRGQHATLTALRMMGPAYQQLARLFGTAGLRLELPFLDDQVIEAALAVRPHERTTPWQHKPLLAEAMRGILPESLAARTAARRTAKGELAEDLHVGLRRRLPDILEIFADSTLATHGLINPDLLRRQMLQPQLDITAMIALEDLLGCETWLRAALRPHYWIPRTSLLV